MPYRVKHIPSGLYYQPMRHRGSNLSKNGKLYHTEANASRVFKTSQKITIWVNEKSTVYKMTKEILDYKKSGWGHNQVFVQTEKDEWIIEEVGQKAPVEKTNESKDLKKNIQTPIPGKRYVHYKGGHYHVLHLAPHTETGELLVIYQSLLFGTYHARPLENWCTPVNNNPRFWPYTE